MSWIVTKAVRLTRTNVEIKSKRYLINLLFSLSFSLTLCYFLSLSFIRRTYSTWHISSKATKAICKRVLRAALLKKTRHKRTSSFPHCCCCFRYWLNLSCRFFSCVDERIIKFTADKSKHFLVDSQFPWMLDWTRQRNWIGTLVTCMQIGGIILFDVCLFVCYHHHLQFQTSNNDQINIKLTKTKPRIRAQVWILFNIHYCCVTGGAWNILRAKHCVFSMNK